MEGIVSLFIMLLTRLAVIAAVVAAVFGLAIVNMSLAIFVIGLFLLLGLIWVIKQIPIAAAQMRTPL